MVNTIHTLIVIIIKTIGILPPFVTNPHNKRSCPLWEEEKEGSETKTIYD